MKLLEKNLKNVKIKSFLVGKKILCIGIFAFIVVNGYTQIKRINTKVNINKGINSRSILVSKGNINTLKAVKFSKNRKISDLKRLTISKIDLTRSSRRSSRITPLKPYTPNLYIDFFGSYSKGHFILESRRLDLRLIQTDLFSGFVTFNAQRGKEYRMKITTVINTFNKTVIIGLGDVNYRIDIKKESKDINFIFRVNEAGYMVIGISPALLFINSDPTGKIDRLYIKSIQIDEL